VHIILNVIFIPIPVWQIFKKSFTSNETNIWSNQIISPSGLAKEKKTSIFYKKLSNYVAISNQKYPQKKPSPKMMENSK